MLHLGSERLRVFILGLLAALFAIGVIVLVSRQPQGRGIELFGPQPTPTQSLRVYVNGAVAAPGVYTLPAGSIVQDALAAAGGPATSADLNRLNLAAPLADGQQVSVPEAGDAVESLSEPTATGLAPGQKININTATVNELEDLPEIGETRAQRIVDYRTENGPFKSTNDIMKVTGIGPGIYEVIKNQITVGP